MAISRGLATTLPIWASGNRSIATAGWMRRFSPRKSLRTAEATAVTIFMGHSKRKTLDNVVPSSSVRRRGHETREETHPTATPAPSTGCYFTKHARIIYPASTAQHEALIHRCNTTVDPWTPAREQSSSALYLPAGIFSCRRAHCPHMHLKSNHPDLAR